jgi:hypothetical protein
VNFHLLSYLRMAAYYNFGIELEMIVTPHKPRDSQNYQIGTGPMEYNISYFKRLASALTTRGLQAKARSSNTMHPPPGLRGWFITSDASVIDENGSTPKPPRGESSFF